MTEPGYREASGESLLPSTSFDCAAAGAAARTRESVATSRFRFIGQCCNLERAGTGRARYGTASSRNLEQSCNAIETALNLTDPYSSCLPFRIACIASY